jgi:hypothetical protein
MERKTDCKHVDKYASSSRVCVDKNDCMTVTPLADICENGQKVVVLSPGLSILNSFMLLMSCGSKLFHQNFRLILDRDIIEEGDRVP